MCTFTCSSQPEAGEALHLLLDLVLNPALDQDCFDMERDVVLEEIAQYSDQPDDQVLQTALGLCLAPQPTDDRSLAGNPAFG